MATPLDPQVREELAKEFMIKKEECDRYNDFYEKQVLPCINKRFFAHMVAFVEDMIYAKIMERANEERKKNPSKQETGTPALRRYNIIVSDNVPPRNGAAFTRCFPQGAIIMYKRNDDKNDIKKERELRIFIAHELGHLLLKHGVINGDPHTENYANLLAYFIINGKNDFYTNEAPEFMYDNDELEIIKKIKDACPVNKENQISQEIFI